MTDYTFNEEAKIGTKRRATNTHKTECLQAKEHFVRFKRTKSLG